MIIGSCRWFRWDRRLWFMLPAKVWRQRRCSQWKGAFNPQRPTSRLFPWDSKCLGPTMQRHPVSSPTTQPCRLFVTGVCRVMLCAASGFVLASFIIHTAPTEKLQWRAHATTNNSFFFFLAEEVEPPTLLVLSPCLTKTKHTLLLWGNGATAPVCLREQRRNNIRIMEEARVRQHVRVRHVSNTNIQILRGLRKKDTQRRKRRSAVLCLPEHFSHKLIRKWDSCSLIPEALTLTVGSRNNPVAGLSKLNFLVMAALAWTHKG